MPPDKQPTCDACGKARTAGEVGLLAQVHRPPAAKVWICDACSEPAGPDAGKYEGVPRGYVFGPE